MTCPPPRLMHAMRCCMWLETVYKGLQHCSCHSRPLDRNPCLFSATSTALIRSRTRHLKNALWTDGTTAQIRLISTFFRRHTHTV